jgi:type IV pilus assembly protein PilB
MIDMGVPSYLVASSVVAILAQRLVRTICPKCRTKYRPTEETLKDAGLTEEQIENATFMRGKGCNSCNKSGYRGRMGIHEILLVDGKVREMIFANASSMEIRDYVVANGMATLFQDGLEKVMGGFTTFEEVYRVAKQTEADAAAH